MPAHLEQVESHLASRAMHPLGGPLAMATPLHSFPPMGPQNTRLDVEDTSPLPPMSSHLLSPPAEVHQVITFDTHTQVHQVITFDRQPPQPTFTILPKLPLSST